MAVYQLSTSLTLVNECLGLSSGLSDFSICHLVLSVVRDRNTW